MAVVHHATISPTKAEVLELYCGEPVTQLGSYRFDDPDGEVGVEGFVVLTGAGTRHVVLTYRSAPLDGAESSLVTTMEHSVLGERWVYVGTADPVAVACFRRALLGEQEQALVEIWDGGKRVGTRDPSMRLVTVPGTRPAGDGVPVIATDPDAPAATDGPQLRAEWDGGAGVVAVLR